jgi:pimeloyl-ACP methyl ester carboxylesterase
MLLPGQQILYNISDQVPIRRRRFLRSLSIILTAAVGTSRTMSTHNNSANAPQTFDFSDNTQVNFELHGRGARTLVMLHGFGASLETWRDVEPALAEHFKLYLIDLKGHGLSSRPRDNHYSIENQAEIVGSFILKKQLRNVVLVGHSYGGAVALMTYLKLRDQAAVDPVTALILLDAAAYPQTFPFFISGLRNPLFTTLVLPFVPAHTRASHTLRRLFFDPKKVGALRIERYARFYTLPGASYALIECARQVVPSDAAHFIQRFPSITTPTLIIWGQNDPVIALAMARRLQADIRGSVLRVIPQCGHIPHEEKPADAARYIISFLEPKES